MMLPPIIGLSGFIGTGKDEVANILVRDFGYRRLSFADCLKREVQERFPRMLREITIRDEVHGELPQLPDNMRWHADHDADPDWWQTRFVYALWQEKSPTIRALLQEYGTEVRRRDNAQYWIGRWDWERARLLDAPRMVIADVRFLNEACLVTSRGGAIWLVERAAVTPAPGAWATLHESERLPTLPHAEVGWGAVIPNDSTLEDLAKVVRATLEAATR